MTGAWPPNTEFHQFVPALPGMISDFPASPGYAYLVGEASPAIQRRTCDCGCIGVRVLRLVVDRGISIGTMPHAEITLFTTAFQGTGYLFMMAVANVCYFVGPLSESLVKPTNVDLYRRMTFQLGLWFSVLLPFTIPMIVGWSYLVHSSTAATR